MQDGLQRKENMGKGERQKRKRKKISFVELELHTFRYPGRCP
jgi:hypothetical protein